MQLQVAAESGEVETVGVLRDLLEQHARSTHRLNAVETFGARRGFRRGLLSGGLDSRG